MTNKNSSSNSDSLIDLLDGIQRRINQAAGIAGLLTDAMNDRHSNAAWAVEHLLEEAQEMLLRYDGIARGANTVESGASNAISS